MQIRPAVRADIEPMLAIYNYEVRNEVSTFDTEPKTLTQQTAWFNRHNTGNHPLLVCEIDGHVAGYASLSAYRDKDAYASTVELSVYVAPRYRRRGAATRLLEAILEEARNDERTHLVVSVITGGNDVSVHLHERFGFTHCGTIREVGYKFDRYLDIEQYSLKV